MSASKDAGRLFVAVPLSGELRTELTAHLDSAMGGRPLPGRRVRPGSWHLTLRFLGDSTARERDQVVESLAGEDLGRSFTLGFDGLGAFPRPERARVLWIGTGEGTESVRRLAESAERAARAAGFERERRPFSSHLTLSRLRPEEDVSGLISRMPPFDATEVVREIVLYRSHLDPGGARYEAVGRFALGDATGTDRLD